MTWVLPCKAYARSWVDEGQCRYPTGCEPKNKKNTLYCLHKQWLSKEYLRLQKQREKDKDSGSGSPCWNFLKRLNFEPCWICRLNFDLTPTLIGLHPGRPLINPETPNDHGPSFGKIRWSYVSFPLPPTSSVRLFRFFFLSMRTLFIFVHLFERRASPTFAYVPFAVC